MSLDKFYTSTNIAKKFIDKINDKIKERAPKI